MKIHRLGITLLCMVCLVAPRVWAQPVDPAIEQPNQVDDEGQSPEDDNLDPNSPTTPPGNTASPQADANTPPPTVTNSMIEDPEPLYVQFKRLIPLMPGSLNMFGYEHARTARGIPVLSPDRRWMIGTEVFYQPINKQTYSRVSLYPVGPAADMTRILPPEELSRINDQYNVQLANQVAAQAPPPQPGAQPAKPDQPPQQPRPPQGPEPMPVTPRMPSVKSADPANGTSITTLPPGPIEARPVPINPDILGEVNPHVFWDRYVPEKQFKNRVIIYEAGFDRYRPYRDDIIQAADWSGDGHKLLMIYRPSVIHIGTYRSIPVIYNTDTGQVTRYTITPRLIWHDFLTHYPELAQPANRVWDIRPMGWSSQNPSDEMVVKLVVFEGQSELPGAFYTFNTADNTIRYLGNSIDPGLIAHNGWTVTFADPYDPRGPQQYAYGEEPEKRPPKPEKRGVGQRLRFWKKADRDTAQQ